MASARLGWFLHIDAGGQPVLVRETSTRWGLRWVRAALYCLAEQPRSIAILLRRLEAFADRSAGRWPDDHAVTRGIERALAELRAMRDALMETPLTAA